MKSRRRLDFHDQAEQGTEALAHPWPADLSPVDWQRGLRRRYGREQAFVLENLGAETLARLTHCSNACCNSIAVQVIVAKFAAIRCCRKSCAVTGG